MKQNYKAVGYKFKTMSAKLLEVRETAESGDNSLSITMPYKNID